MKKSISKNKSNPKIYKKNKSNIVFNKIESFKNISKNNVLTDLKNNKCINSNNSNTSNSNCSINSKEKTINKTLTQKSFITETSTTASKRNKELKINNKSTINNELHYNVIEDLMPKKIHNKCIPNIQLFQNNKKHNIFDFTLKNKFQKYHKKRNLRLKNYSVVYNKNAFNDNISLISDESAFNNDGSQKHSNKNSISNSIKSKSNSIDFTYSDDEIVSNRKKSKNMLKKVMKDNNINPTIKVEKNKKINFDEFCEQINKKLFCDLNPHP